MSSSADCSDVTLVEGASAVGYSPGATPAKGLSQDPPCSWASAGARGAGPFGALIRSIAGYTRARAASGFKGNEHLNGVHDRAITPALEVEGVSSNSKVLACLTIASCKWKNDLADTPDIEVTWSDDGFVSVQWDNESLEIPPLAT